MKIGKILSEAFEKIPEVSLKNDLRYFLAFNRFIPNKIANMSPIKGYELYRELKKGDIVVDAGSFPGDYAVYASRKVGREGKVICFEPNKKNRKILRKNLSKERYNNYLIIPKGLWNKEKVLKIKDFDGLHTELSSEGAESIKVTSLDKELKKLGIKKVDVIKMDIEGAEKNAVKGMKDTLKKCNPYVMIASYHVVDGERTSKFLEEFFKKEGFNVKSDFEMHLTTYAWKN